MSPRTAYWKSYYHRTRKRRLLLRRRREQAQRWCAWLIKVVCQPSAPEPARDIPKRFPIRRPTLRLPGVR